MGSLRFGHCRSCDAPIVWGRHRTGRWAPFDAECTEAGEWLLLEDGDAVKRLPGVPAMGRVPHHATCPQAASWRDRAREGT